jgi:hypothetical protein
MRVEEIAVGKAYLMKSNGRRVTVTKKNGKTVWYVMPGFFEGNDLTMNPNKFARSVRELER